MDKEVIEAAKRESITHELKTDPEVFQAICDGRKTYEIRYADRDFQVGDELYLRETVYTGEQMRHRGGQCPLLYSGRECRVRISHILRGPIYGIADGWAILSIATPPADTTPDAALLVEAEHWARLTRMLTPDIEQGCAHVLRLATALRKSRTREQAAEKIIESALNTLPVGYIPNHTPETIPSRIADLMTRCAETDRVEDERDAALARAEQAEAALADSNASLALCAENTAAADLAQEVECLKAEKEALREALGKIAARDTGYDRKKVDNLINSDNGDEVAEGAEMGEAHACANIARAALAIGGEAAQ